MEPGKVVHLSAPMLYATGAQTDIMIKNCSSLLHNLVKANFLYIYLKMTREFFSSFPLPIKFTRESTLREMEHVMGVPAGI